MKKNDSPTDIGKMALIDNKSKKWIKMQKRKRKRKR